MINFPNDDPRANEFIKLVNRLRYERHVADEIDAIVEAAFNEIADVISSGKYREITAFQQTRMQQLFRELERVIDRGYAKVSAELLTEMRQYASFEADVARETVKALLASAGDLSIELGPILPKNYLTSVAKLPIQGLDIGEWFEGQAQTMTRETKRTIQQALIEGKPSAEIARRIAAPVRSEVPAVSKRARREATIVSRTTVNAVQNDAARASNESLPRSVSDSYEYMAVMDSRTSDICSELNGRVFKYDDPKAVYPPQHPNCRSTTAPLIKGIDVTIQDQRGQITMRGFDSWLKDQTTTDQNDLLGSAAAERWRNGSLNLAEAIGSDTRTLNLQQLKERLLPQRAGV